MRSTLYQHQPLLSPEAFQPVPGGWGAQGWTMVTLAKIDRGELELAL